MKMIKNQQLAINNISLATACRSSDEIFGSLVTYSTQTLYSIVIFLIITNLLFLVKNTFAMSRSIVVRNFDCRESASASIGILVRLFTGLSQFSLKTFRINHEGLFEQTMVVIVNSKRTEWSPEKRTMKVPSNATVLISTTFVDKCNILSLRR